MKALIKFYVPGFHPMNGNHQKTIEVSEKEPNLAVRTLINKLNLPKYTFIYNIKIGCTEYQWKGPAHDAFS